MLISPFDIAIILISAVACMYCIVLSRRLKALQNTRNGLGATIKALSDSISAVSATTDETRYHAGELAARLARLIEEAKLSCARIEDVTQRLSDAQFRAEAHLRHAQQAPLPTMPVAPPPMRMEAQPQQDMSDQRIQEISDLMDKLKDLTEASVSTAETASPTLRPLPTQLRSRMKVV
ncbi:MAG: hypothetical protein AAFR51_17985 [Pseudomonadota bacterium]